jgi:hypothetical protein
MHLHWKHACNNSVLNIQVRCSLTYKRRITVHGAAISALALCGRTLSDTSKGGCQVWGPSPRYLWRILSSWMWRSTVWYKVTIVLRELTVPIFMTICRKRRQAVISSEKSVTLCQTACRHPRREDYLQAVYVWEHLKLMTGYHRKNETVKV